MAALNSPNFGVRSVHVPVPLQNLTIGYHPTGFIAERVMPPVKVANESDYFWRWDKGQAFRIGRTDGRASLRPDKSKAKTVNFGAILDQYFAEEWALRVECSDRELRNADSALNFAASKINRTQDLVLIDQEIRVASIVQATGNYPAGNFVTLAGASQWNNASFVSQPAGQHSAIKAVIDAGREAVRKQTGGKRPNLMVIPPAVATVMNNDPGLVDLIKYYDQRGALLAGDLLPSMLWGMEVLVPLAEYNTSVIEGEAVSLTDIWGKNVWMGYVDPGLSLDKLTFGTIMRNQEWSTRSFRDEERKVTIYEPGMIQAEKLISGDCGYLIQNAIA